MLHFIPVGHFKKVHQKALLEFCVPSVLYQRSHVHYVTCASCVMLSCVYCSSVRAGRSQYGEWVGSVAIAMPTIPMNMKWVWLSGGLSAALPSSLLTYGMIDIHICNVIIQNTT